jgi:uncharacterized protein
MIGYRTFSMLKNLATLLLPLLAAALITASCGSGDKPTPLAEAGGPTEESPASPLPLPGEKAPAETPAPAPESPADPGEPRILAWEELIPADWRLEDLFAEYDLENIGDDDALADELLAKLRQAWGDAPVVEGLDGKLVRLPGFVVPLDFEAKTVREFLLVPYYGACVHTPPPPSNQTVYVKTPPAEIELFDTVWVTGILSAKRFSSEMAEAGYTIQARSVESYVDPELTIP